MKTPLLLLALLFTVASQAQKKSLQIGAVATFLGHDYLQKNESCIGSELTANFSIQKNITIGPGVQVVKFNTEDNLYVPVFATFKLDLPAEKFVYFLQADAGYGIHSFKNSFTDTSDNGIFKLDFKNTGGFYFSSGAGIKLKCKTAPFINFRYSLYGFRFVTKNTDINQAKEYVYEQRNTGKGFTITAGIFLDRNHTK